MLMLRCVFQRYLTKSIEVINSVFAFISDKTEHAETS